MRVLARGRRRPSRLSRRRSPCFGGARGRAARRHAPARARSAGIRRGDYRPAGLEASTPWSIREHALGCAVDDSAKRRSRQSPCSYGSWPRRSRRERKPKVLICASGMGIYASLATSHHRGQPLRHRLPRWAPARWRGGHRGGTRLASGSSTFASPPSSAARTSTHWPRASVRSAMAGMVELGRARRDPVDRRARSRHPGLVGRNQRRQPESGARASSPRRSAASSAEGQVAVPASCCDWSSARWPTSSCSPAVGSSRAGCSRAAIASAIRSSRLRCATSCVPRRDITRGR